MKKKETEDANAAANAEGITVALCELCSGELKIISF